jgi:hypothetical protein
MTLRSLTTQVNEGSLQMSEDQMFVEVFGPKHHGRVRGYGKVSLLQNYRVPPRPK